MSKNSTPKDKNVAAILALTLGWAGVHRFYLGQVGLGILYIFLMGSGFSAVLGLIDALAFFFMDQKKFDEKYNKERARSYYRPRSRSARRRQRAGRRPLTAEEEAEARRIAERVRNKKAYDARLRQFIKSGKEAFKNFDYDKALENFSEALKLDPHNPAILFNMACLYSLEEKEKEALEALDKAVQYGFDDFSRIETHEALAWLRTQADFKAFREENYRLKHKKARKKIEVKEEQQQQEPDLLEQLNRLKQLRERGMLTEMEYRRELEKLKR